MVNRKLLRASIIGLVIGALLMLTAAIGLFATGNEWIILGSFSLFALIAAASLSEVARHGRLAHTADTNKGHARRVRLALGSAIVGIILVALFMVLALLSSVTAGRASETLVITAWVCFALAIANGLALVAIHIRTLVVRH